MGFQRNMKTRTTLLVELFDGNLLFNGATTKGRRGGWLQMMFVVPTLSMLQTLAVALPQQNLPHRQHQFPTVAYPRIAASVGVGRLISSSTVGRVFNLHASNFGETVVGGFSRSTLHTLRLSWR